MRTFNFFIHDLRLAVPIHDVETASDATAALELARNRLETSSHYRAVEISEGGVPVARIDRDRVTWLDGGD